MLIPTTFFTKFFVETNYYHYFTISIIHGISVGDGLEYVNEVTLGRSIVNRIPFEQSIKS